MKNIIVIGCSGHAKVVIDIIEQERKYKIVGLIDVKENINKSIYSYKVIGTEYEINKLKIKYNFNSAIVAIGDNFKRYNVVNTILTDTPDIKFINAIHPSVNIGKNVQIGTGNVFVAGCNINADSSIGNHCIINTNASLGHDAKMNNFSSLSSNATVGGGSEIGEKSLIALSSTLLHNIKVGKNTIVGSASLVVRDLEDNIVVMGVPAIKIRDNHMNSKFL